MTRVLIFTPTWLDPKTGEDAIRPECEASIKAQVFDEFDWHVGTDNPYAIGDYRNVLHQYQAAREWFLNWGDCESIPYEAMLTVEHDNVLPDPGALQRMFDTPGDVIYAPYMLRHGARFLNTWTYENDRQLGEPLNHHKLEFLQALVDVVYRVSGAGFGCTLMRRAVLEKIEFTPPAGNDDNWVPDLRFAKACLAAGFVANGRFDVPVGHFDEEGRLLQPWRAQHARG
jgi:hypothetical protein